MTEMPVTSAANHPVEAAWCCCDRRPTPASAIGFLGRSVYCEPLLWFARFRFGGRAARTVARLASGCTESPPTTPQDWRFPWR